jgi:hypothetical protein
LAENAVGSGVQIDTAVIAILSIQQRDPAWRCVFAADCVWWEGCCVFAQTRIGLLFFLVNGAPYGKVVSNILERIEPLTSHGILNDIVLAVVQPKRLLDIVRQRHLQFFFKGRQLPIRTSLLQSDFRQVGREPFFETLPRVGYGTWLTFFGLGNKHGADLPGIGYSWLA